MSDKSAAQIFGDWQGTIAANADKAKEIDAVYQFKLTGDETANWILDMTKPEVREGLDEGAQCTVTMESTDFVDMVTGKVQGQQLFMMGKLMIEGDMGLAMRLQQVFETAAA